MRVSLSRANASCCSRRVTSAFAAQLLANRAGEDGNMLFTAGLLHDIGKAADHLQSFRVNGSVIHATVTNEKDGSTAYETLTGGALAATVLTTLAVGGGWGVVSLTGSLAWAFAILALFRMQQNDQRPEDGPVVVTGATGGVGMLAIDILTRAGYAVEAISGKPLPKRLPAGLPPGLVLADHATVVLDRRSGLPLSLVHRREVALAGATTINTWTLTKLAD